MRKLLVWLVGVLALSATPLWSQPLGIKEGEKVTPAPLTVPVIVRASVTVDVEKADLSILISQRSLRLADKNGGGPGGRNYLCVWEEAKPSPSVSRCWRSARLVNR
jgi:hypothetical protein